MTTNRELLELAAKAAGLNYSSEYGCYFDDEYEQERGMTITPLEPLLLCPKCKTPMAAGVYIKQTYSGTPDFPNGEVVTQYVSGPGKLTECMKCPACGWSTT